MIQNQKERIEKISCTEYWWSNLSEEEKLQIQLQIFKGSGGGTGKTRRVMRKAERELARDLEEGDSQ
ncbi:hypothetical protein SAMN04488691_105115 [Haloferax larsenii]|uniref:Uncharacterized protein n=1 Tax=Haloferax larsenii TaxID=302484 RepID=A0A1H7QR18_HALLR|nr:hypothetical protein SAMN04488691_105115 [Haloferax larsenii]